MHHITRLVTLLALAFCASDLAAQDCRQSGDPLCPPDQPPTIGVSFGTPRGNLSVVDIYASDDYGLIAGTFRLTVNGIAQSWGFTLGNGGASGSTRNEIALISGTNTVTATICDDRSLDPTLQQCTTTTATYQYTPPPPPPQWAHPTISLAPHSGGIRNVSQGSVTLSYRTPEYVSLDQGRTVTLYYASGQASPRGFVQVDASVNSVQPPAKLSIQVLNPAGSAVTAETFYTAGVGDHRLAAEWDASSYGTSALVHTVRVRAYWNDGTMLESSAPVRVIVVDERRSRFGAGWTLPGIQRLYVQNDGVLLTEGDGTAAFFTRTATGFDSPAGDFTRLAYDAASGLYTRTYPDGATAVFSWNGYLYWTQDRFGNRTSIQWFNNYEGIPVPYRITDPAGHVTEFAYHTATGSHYGKLASIRDPGGRVTYFGYWDGWDNLTDVQDVTGGSGLRVAYDGAPHRALRWTPRGSGEWSVEYDAFSQLGVLYAPQVSTDAGQVRPATRYRSLQAAVLPPAGTGGSTPAPRVLPTEVRISTTGPDGLTSRMAVDRFGALLRVEDPHGDVQSWERDEHGRVRAEHQPRGGYASYAYSDDRYNPHATEIKNLNSGSVTTIGYTSLYRDVETVSLNGLLRERRFYSADYRQVDSVRVDTSVTRFRYDGRGRRTWVQDPERHETTIRYTPDGWQNTASVTRTGGVGPGTTTYAYDGYGRPTTVTDPTSRTGTTGYDLLNRVESYTFQGTTTTYGYDDANRIYTVTDARGQVYTTRLNAAGWRVSDTDPRGGSRSVAYDAAGRPSRYTNRRGGTITLAYDSVGRIRSRTTSDGKTTTWTHGADGWTAISNEESTDTIFPEAWNRPAKSVTVRGGRRYEVELRYDMELGLRDGLTARGPWGTRETGYTYDRAARLSGLWVGVSPSRMDYTREGFVNSVTLPTGGGYSTNQLRQTFTYTPGHRMQSVAYDKSALQYAFGRTYGYDALDRLSTVTRAAAGTNGAETRTVSYDAFGRLAGYDDVRRWTEIVRHRATVCPMTTRETCYWEEEVERYQTLRAESYTYDAVGNRTDHGAVLENGNRLAQFDGFQLFYDNDGNLTRRYKPSAGIDWYYGWNALGQLVQVSGTSDWGGTWHTISYGYDGMGRRVRKTVNGVTTGYLYDGEDLLMELNGAGNAVLEYTYYPGTDRPHSVRRSSDGAMFYYVTEQPGHVVGLVDANNQVVNEYRYDPWGNAITVREQVPQTLRYAAREYDAETGLYFMRARYYDPRVGRFISEDPTGLGGGINPYAYVGNNPVGRTDPSGLSPCDNPMTPGTVELCPVVVHPSAGHDHSMVEFAQSLLDLLQDWMADQEFVEPYEPVEGSSCWIARCELRDPEGAERDRVVAVLNSIRQDVPFCREVQRAGLEMVNRQLLFWDNFTPNPHGPGQMYGNAPFDPALGGPVMYLYSKDFGDFTRQVIVHEAVHGVIRRYDLRGQPMYYPDSKTDTSLYTPLGTPDQTARTCLRM